MKIANLTGIESISTDLKSNNKTDMLVELSELLTKRIPHVSNIEIIKVLSDRERLATTGIGGKVAIPHGKLERVSSIFAAFGVSKKGIPFGSVDNELVHIFVALVAPLNSSGDPLKALAKISRILKHPETIEKIRNARNREELFEVIKEEDGKS